MIDTAGIDATTEGLADAPHVAAMVSVLERADLGELAVRSLDARGGVAWALRPVLARSARPFDAGAGLRGLTDVVLPETALTRLRSWVAPLAREHLLRRSLPKRGAALAEQLLDVAPAVAARDAVALLAAAAPDLVHHHREGLYGHTVRSALSAPRGPCVQMRSASDPVPPAVGAALERAVATELLPVLDGRVLYDGLATAGPVHPDAAWLWGPLFDQWHELCQARGPGGVAPRRAWHPTLSMDGPTLAFVEGERELARIELVRRPVHAPLRPAAATAHDTDQARLRDLCGHALDLLRRRHGLSKQLATALGSGGAGTRVLELLDLHLADDEVPSAAMLGWRVHRDEQGATRLTEVHCTPEGDGWKVVRFPDDEVRRQAGRIDADDRATQIRRSLRGAAPSAHRGREAAGMIRALVGHPRLFAGPRGRRPLTVRRSEAVLDLRPLQRGLQVRWEVRPGDVMSSGDALRLMRDHGDGRYGVYWVGDDEIVLVDFRHAEGVALALDHAADWVPPAAIDGFLERLPGIAHRSRVRVDPSLEGEVRRPDDTLVVRIASIPGNQLTVELRVAPAGPALGLHPPGHGPASLYGCDATGRFVVPRDLAIEETRAAELAAHLRLGGREPSTPWRWECLPLERAVEVMKALSDRPELDVHWLTGRVSLHSVVEMSTLRVSLVDRGAWYEVDGELDLGDGLVVPLDELLRQLRGQQVVVTMDHAHVLAFTEELRRELLALHDLTEPLGPGRKLVTWAAPSFADALSALEVTPEHPPSWGPRLEAMRQQESAGPLPPLSATLRPYQQRGIRWLQQLSSWAPGGCLADDMGLGKTLQALGLLVHRADLGPALVVVPTSVLRNWQREAERFAPSLTVCASHGPRRPTSHDARGPGDVVLTTWGTLVRDLHRLREVTFATVVLDEAQAIKNARTVRARAVRELRADFRLALSGTPVENAPEELWALFDALVPGLLGDQVGFDRRFAIPMASAGGRGDAAELLARLVRPFLLRRRKRQVARDLPPRDEVVVHVALSPHERAAYERVRRSVLAAVSDEPIGNGRQVLAAITRLRQLACHPRLVDPAGPATSSKLTAVRRSLLELTDAGHQVLVFSQWVTLLDLLDTVLAPDGLRIARLHGSMTPAARQREVDRFQRGEADVFLVSLHAGGTGLNLTAASYVVHLDSWWNPAVHDQATDRAHRIGQTKPVTVLHFVTEATVEDTIMTLQQRKRAMVEGLLEGSDAATRLTARELLSLIEEGGVSELPLGYDDEPVAPREPSAPPTGPDDLVALLGPTLPWPLHALEPRLARGLERWGATLRRHRSPVAKNHAKALYRMLRWALEDGRHPEHVDDLEELAIAYRRALDLGLVEAPRRGDRTAAPLAVRRWLAGLDGQIYS